MSEKKLNRPATKIPLPSKGELYPEEHPLANGEFEFYYPTTREEDILVSPSLIKSGDVLDVLIDNVAIYDSRFNSLKVLTCDRNAIMMAIRTTLFPNGHLYNANINCRNCGKPFDKEFDMTGLPYVELGIEPLEKRTNLFAYEFPTSKWKIKFRFLYGEDEKIIRKLSEKNEQRKRN